MKRSSILLLIIILLISILKFDNIKNYVKSEKERILKVEFCNDMYMGRPELLNECLKK